MSATTTMITDLIDPEVMADMIDGKIEKKIVVTPFAKLDTTLQGVPGSTITVPQYKYIGDAEDVAEGVECGTTKLEATSTTVTIKKAMKGVTITDESILCGYGDPVGQANTQLAMSIAAKVDNDAMDALQTAQLAYDGSAAVISYDGIVDAVDVFSEEKNTEKAIFVHPKQVTQLRHDTNFLSADKYPGQVIVTGEIGTIAGCHVVPSLKVPLNSAGTAYLCPIVKLEHDDETDDETAALTIYLKRNTNVEKQRVSRSRKTDITVDKFYAVALSNQSKVVLASFKAAK